MVKRKHRLYGLFLRPVNGRRWTREYPNMAYPKQAAIRIFQDRLLTVAMSGVGLIAELRPVKDPR